MKMHPIDGAYIKGELCIGYHHIDGMFYPAGIIFRGYGSGDNASVRGKEKLPLGPSRETEYTEKEIYQFLHSFNPSIANCVKNLYIYLIEEDISQ